MADYKFIAKEEIEETVTLHRECISDCNVSDELKDLAERLLAEREAYREAAVKWTLANKCSSGGLASKEIRDQLVRSMCQDEVDAEAARLLEASRGLENK